MKTNQEALVSRWGKEAKQLLENVREVQMEDQLQSNKIKILKGVAGS
jgi:hypothetical protein